MDKTTTERNRIVRGNWMAFLFGAAFTVLANTNLTFLADYFLPGVIGGVVVLIFKMISDVFGPLWLLYRERMRPVAPGRKPHKTKKRNRHGRP